MSYYSQKIKSYVYMKSSIGSPMWLIGCEMKYGGIVRNVTRRKVSHLDPRAEIDIKKGGMTGGDRMKHHGYAKTYAKFLKPYINSSDSLVIAEFGILKGTGLAMWSELFPTSKIFGFDIDLSHINENMDYLISRGAFNNAPILHEFDQFLNNEKILSDILDHHKINICIDDGFHSDESILMTFESVRNVLSDSFVYFIEDNKTVYKKIIQKYQDVKVFSFDELTVVTSA
ncbi:MAG: hypothetical protein EVA58_01920 [Kiritimatiellaceae bacterium]|nr:MAG: hypothetical protein EVA58_01920 [Kiritimatiellaceae bacterium]